MGCTRIRYEYGVINRKYWNNGNEWGALDQGGGSEISTESPEKSFRRAFHRVKPDNNVPSGPLPSEYSVGSPAANS